VIFFPLVRDLSTNNTLFLAEVEALKSERDALQASLTILQSNEGEYKEDFAHAIQWKTILLHTQNATLIDELGLRNEIIDCLFQEKSSSLQRSLPSFRRLLRHQKKRFICW
jgi:hypothetical protein